ncbi:hypothetical protein PC116_g25949 [Phytophthora cactorum]|nr:hypothetical protein Pcac1_g19510 [Phytophthora cactorum]KAG2826889.1 hypothetical protein PC113_g21710 [Phytophthora cactorum]KAG2887361.1 hypothetical protein PC117_g25176 [Phytophthora cactorum]KAG2981757.1 hypothetical protein PC120_g24761 [Phytophthora cactorum]KAG3043271.1 hypothetical protein PC121_g22657 [Phytophthora cactorum]
MGYDQFSDKDFATVMEDEESPPKKQRVGVGKKMTGMAKKVE